MDYEDDHMNNGLPTPAATPAPGRTQRDFGHGGDGNEDADGDGEEHEWKNTTDTPSSRRTSTRLMKSPPSGHQASAQSTPGSRQPTARGGDERTPSPAPSVHDDDHDDEEEEEDNVIVKQRTVEEANEYGGGGGRNDVEEPRPSRSRRRKPADNSRIEHLMTKTKGEMRGAGSPTSRGRRSQPRRGRHDHDANNDDEAEIDGGDNKYAENGRSSPSRSRRNHHDATGSSPRHRGRPNP